MWSWTAGQEDTSYVVVVGSDCQVMTAHARARGLVLVEVGTMAGYGTM